MTFPEKLLAERSRLGLTQAESAALLEISKSALEKWEAGIKTPLMLTQEGALARMAKAKPSRQNVKVMAAPLAGATVETGVGP